MGKQKNDGVLRLSADLLYRFEKFDLITRDIGSVRIYNLSFAVSNKYMRYDRNIHSSHEILILIKEKKKIFTPATALGK